MVFFHRIDNSSPFTTSYRCYPVSFLADNFRSSVEKGGKIIMPPSALDVLTRLNVQYPMLFKLTNQQANRTTHCGVLEFVADEGRIYVPYWMLKNLDLEEGGLVSVVNAALPVASFARFQPQSTDFLDISNPKAVLENALRDFACLTVGDIIAISYNERIYELKVLETKPKDAVTIIECDMSVDFAPPVGYQSTDSGSLSKLDNVNAHQIEEDHIEIPSLVQGFQAFSGTGYRLDGKTKQDKTNETNSDRPLGPSKNRERGVPNYDYHPGSLTFFRNSKLISTEKTEESVFKPFGGTGHQLKSHGK
uniref:SJCHGC05907 protein n=1 Tax=Schistosoma japonicum TaxID=6182 RepID=Q5DCI7_SCHJA|nr:SJCHGC05907 protein [Schistosoma japonicum]